MSQCREVAKTQFVVSDLDEDIILEGNEEVFIPSSQLYNSN